MNFERTVRRESVREGYMVLLRAEAELLLPRGLPRICAFYQRLADACVNWAIEVYGEMVRAYFLALPDVRERSRFHTQSYRFWMRVPWEEMPHVTVLCESTRSALDGTQDFYRICHTWNVGEETVLPPAQVKSLLCPAHKRGDAPFAPDGIYREGDALVMFQNRGSNHPFLEVKIPIEP